ncbi:MAG TPA: hypothetical protein PLP87_05705, partial [Clostridiales bacterium]|nr:hypothetical protein [Clostridiales bacterium]
FQLLWSKLTKAEFCFADNFLSFAWVGPSEVFLVRASKIYRMIFLMVHDLTHGRFQPGRISGHQKTQASYRIPGQTGLLKLRG